MTKAESKPAAGDQEAAILDKGPIGASEELLFRQIHPSQLQGGALSSAIFIPTPDDEDQLSLDRSSLTTAKESFDLFTGNGLSSVAVCGVTVESSAKRAFHAIPTHSQRQRR